MTHATINIHGCLYNARLQMGKTVVHNDIW